MGKMVDGDLVLTEEEMHNLIKIRLADNSRPATEKDRELIARLRGKR